MIFSVYCEKIEPESCAAVLTIRGLLSSDHPFFLSIASVLPNHSSLILQCLFLESGVSFLSEMPHIALFECVPFLPSFAVE